MIALTPRGFTLLEVLVALVLVATVLTLGYTSVRNAALGNERLRERVLAQWVADNRRAEIRIGALPVDERPQLVNETQLGHPYVARVVALDDGKAIEISVSAVANGPVIASDRVPTP